MSVVKVGEVFKYFQNAHVAAINALGDIKVGDTIQFLGIDTNFTQTITSMQSHGKEIKCASTGDEIGVKVTERVHLHDRLFKEVD